VEKKRTKTGCDEKEREKEREKNGEMTYLTHTLNGPSSGTTQVSRYQKGETNLDFSAARDSGWQWH